MVSSSLFPDIIKQTLKSLIRSFALFNIWELKHLEKKGTIIPMSEMDNFLNVANNVLIKPALNIFRVGLVKDLEYLGTNDYFVKRAYWPKYERFLKNNKISYSFYDIHSSKWMDDAKIFDIIIWATYSSPNKKVEAESKIYFLEKYLKKICFPSFDEIWSYEDKVRNHFIFTHFGLPAAPTFTANSKIDALKFLDKTSFPLISKIRTGSSSSGVLRLKNKNAAISYVNSCFSDVGRKTYWPFVRQKDYVYFQKYIDDAKYDLRIIVVGDKVFGYYRYAKAGDFRASGAGFVEKKELPEEAMKIAINANKLLKSTSLAVDMLYSDKEQKYYIIETSIFCGIDTAEQLVIDGKAGYYEYKAGKFTFKEGRFWIQELALQIFFNSLI